MREGTGIASEFMQEFPTFFPAFGLKDDGVHGIGGTRTTRVGQTNIAEISGTGKVTEGFRLRYAVELHDFLIVEHAERRSSRGIPRFGLIIERNARGVVGNLRLQFF